MSKSGKLLHDNKIISTSAAQYIKISQGSSNDRSDKCLEVSFGNKCKNKSHNAAQLTQSDGNLIKVNDKVGLKQKLVNKVKHWNNKEGKTAQAIECASNKDVTSLASDLESLALTPETSEDNLFKSDWLRARDSLENLLNKRCNKPDIVNSKSTHFPSSEKTILNESPCSESQIGNSKAVNSVSKVLAWDPWDKLSRKNKKENKRRKYEKSTNQDVLHSNKDHTSGDELRNDSNSSNIEIDSGEGSEYIQNYEYQPYIKNIKAVEFTNEVMVVYVTGDEVIEETTEPLKKELDQQIRNKEMRRGHCLTTLFGKRKIEDDYMSAWFRK